MGFGKADQVGNLCHHSPDLRRVGALDNLVKSFQAQAANDFFLPA